MQRAEPIIRRLDKTFILIAADWKSLPKQPLLPEKVENPGAADRKFLPKQPLLPEKVEKPGAADRKFLPKQPISTGKGRESS